MIRFLIGLGLIFVVLPARAEDRPSFDCGKASTEIERMICALPSLAADDRELNAAYTAALKRLPPSGQKILRNSQRDWLKALKIMCLNRGIPQRGTDGYSAECLSLKYRQQAEYFYQHALITLPGGQTLIRQQQIAASDAWDYPRDPTTGAYLDTIRFEVGKEIEFVVVSPRVELLTKESRGALPSALPYFDAVRSINSSAYVVAAFAARDYARLREAGGDFMHEPYRLPKITGATAAIAAGVAAGAFTGWLSGSGSSVLCVAAKGCAADVGRGMAAAFTAVGIESEVRILHADNAGLNLE